MLTHLNGIEYDDNQSKIIFPKANKKKKKAKKMPVITDGEGNPLFYVNAAAVEHPTKDGNAIGRRALMLYSDQEQTDLILKIVSNSLLFIHCEKNEIYDKDDNYLGYIEWDGGPIRAVWTDHTKEDSQIKLREDTSRMKYPFKLATHFIGSFLPGDGIDLSAKTGDLTFWNGDTAISYVSRQGSWLNPYYVLVNQQDLEKAMDRNVLYAFIALETHNE